MKAPPPRDPADAIGAHWNQRVKEERPIRWMTHPWVASKVNQLVGGIDSAAWGDGLVARLRQTFAGSLPFRRGISVACGKGLIELELVKSGLVQSFDCFDFAAERIAEGEKRARRAGLENRVRYSSADAFAAVEALGQYDLVYWRNAIHHMTDTKAALGWSARCLARGGVLYLDDYVGPSRFQYSDRLLADVNEVRAALPERLLARRAPKRGYYPRKMPRPVEADVIRVDPSEAADSANIMAGLLLHFPDADVVKVSGGLFQAGLHDIMGNFDATHDRETLERLWAAERDFIANGHLHWAVALARKS
ncbi:MAG: class I SAM-dependent methyltransferase [Hyphomicrobium sp.]